MSIAAHFRPPRRRAIGGEVLVETEVRCDGLVVLAVRRLFELLFPFWGQPISPHQPQPPYGVHEVIPFARQAVSCGARSAP